MLSVAVTHRCLAFYFVLPNAVTVSQAWLGLLSDHTPQQQYNYSMSDIGSLYMYNTFSLKRINKQLNKLQK